MPLLFFEVYNGISQQAIYLFHFDSSAITRLGIKNKSRSSFFIVKACYINLHIEKQMLPSFLTFLAALMLGLNLSTNLAVAFVFALLTS